MIILRKKVTCYSATIENEPSETALYNDESKK